MPQFDLVPPHADVAKELKEWGAKLDDRYPPSFVVMPNGSPRHWSQALTLMRQQAQLLVGMARFKQVPFYRSSTFLAFLGILITLGLIAVAVITDPTVAEWIPAPWNKLLPPLLSAIGLPRMYKWWEEHRRSQEADLSGQRRAFALGLAAANGDQATASEETSLAALGVGDSSGKNPKIKAE